MVPVEEYDDNHYVLMATKTGPSKTVLTESSTKEKVAKEQLLCKMEMS